MTILTGLELKNIFREHFPEVCFEGKTLFIVLGLLGDFDSFEYAQVLVERWEDLLDKSVDIHI